jgi:hypothetical protein
MVLHREYFSVAFWDQKLVQLGYIRTILDSLMESELDLNGQ